MSSIRIVFAAAVVVTAAFAASAQTAGPLTPPRSSQPSAIPKGKIAVVNTLAFQTDIGEYKSKIEVLNRQFEPRVKEVEGMGDRITALETTIKTQAGALTPAKIAEMTEQLDRMKREYQRKAEDLQADGERARDQALEPLNQKLSNFAIDFTTKRNITTLFDLAVGLNSNVVVWYDPRIDVTKEFIAEYNRANPAAAQPQKP